MGSGAGLTNCAADHEWADSSLRLFRMPVGVNHPYDPNESEERLRTFETWWIRHVDPARPPLPHRYIRSWMSVLGLLMAAGSGPVQFHWIFDPRTTRVFRLAAIWRFTGVGWVLRRLGIHKNPWFALPLTPVRSSR